jgi:hypothetical protein
VPSVSFTGNRYVFGLAFNETASSVLNPADAGQVDLPAAFVNLEVLRVAKRVRGREFPVLFRVSRKTLEKNFGNWPAGQSAIAGEPERCFLQPRILLLPNKQFGAKLGQVDMEVGIRKPTLLIPFEPLVVHPARTAGEATQFPGLSSVGFQLAYKGLANKHALTIHALSKEDTI